MTQLTTPGGAATLGSEFFDEATRRLAGLGLPDRLLTEPAGSALDESWQAACEAGWFRTIAGQDDDGLGLGLVELGALFRAVGHHLLRGPLLDHAVTVPLMLPHAHGAGGDQLRRALDGGVIVTTAESPGPPYGAGPDAVRLRDGRLDGRVELVPFADVADEFVVTATGDGGPLIVLVPATSVECTAVASADPCIDYGTVVLRGVRTDSARIIAQGPSAEALRQQVRGVLRLMAVAELSGIAEEMTARATAYAKTRVQFGRPIGGFQAIRHILATMQGRTSSLRSLSEACLADAAADQRLVPDRGRTAKAYSADVSRYIAEQCLQVHGGMGFTYEVPVHLYLRRVLTLQGYLGEATDLLIEIGKEATS